MSAERDIEAALGFLGWTNGKHRKKARGNPRAIEAGWIEEHANEDKRGVESYEIRITREGMKELAVFYQASNKIADTIEAGGTPPESHVELYGNLVNRLKLA